MRAGWRVAATRGGLHGALVGRYADDRVIPLPLFAVLILQWLRDRLLERRRRGEDPDAQDANIDATAITMDELRTKATNLGSRCLRTCVVPVC